MRSNLGRDKELYRYSGRLVGHKMMIPFNWTSKLSRLNLQEASMFNLFSSLIRPFKIKRYILKETGGMFYGSVYYLVGCCSACGTGNYH